MRRIFLLAFLMSCCSISLWASYPITEILIVPPSGISGWNVASQTFRPIAVSDDGMIMVDVGTISLEIGALEQTVVDSTATISAELQALAAQQATESADLLVAAASDTLIIAAVETVRQEIEDSGVNASETVLIAKLDELLVAAASDTLILAAQEKIYIAIKPVQDVATQSVSLVGAAASVELTSGLSTSRRWISLSSQDLNQAIPIWVNFGGAAAAGTGRLIYTGVSYVLPLGVSVWFYSDTSVNLLVEEGGVI